MTLKVNDVECYTSIFSIRIQVQFQTRRVPCFLKLCVCVCVCVCPHPKGLITSGVIRCDIDGVYLVISHLPLIKWMGVVLVTQCIVNT